MIERYNYRGDPNTGFYAAVTSEVAIVPPEFKRKDFFDVECVETFISRTRLVGIFATGNSNCILVPRSTNDREKNKLEDKDIDFHVLETRENALGNLVLANDNGAVVSSRLEDHVDDISRALEVPVEVAEIAGIPTPGVCATANNCGVLLHRDATEEEAEKIKEVLEVEEVDIGTVNMGSPYIGSGIAGTEKNMLIGEDTTGPEVGRIDRTLHVSDS